MRVYGDESIVGRASAKRSCTRVPNTQRLRARWRSMTNVQLASWRPPRHLGVLFLPSFIVVVIDKVVPAHGLVFGRLELQRRDLILSCIPLVVTSVYQENLMPCNSKPCGKRSTTRAATNDNIVVLGSIGCAFRECITQMVAARIWNSPVLLRAGRQGKAMEPPHKGS